MAKKNPNEYSQFIVYFKNDTSKREAEEFITPDKCEFVKRSRGEENAFIYQVPSENLDETKKEFFRYSQIEGIALINETDKKRYSELEKVIVNLEKLRSTKVSEKTYLTELEKSIEKLSRIKSYSDEDGKEYHPNFTFRKAAKKKK